jgi:hypothetical protein
MDERQFEQYYNLGARTLANGRLEEAKKYILYLRNGLKKNSNIFTVNQIDNFKKLYFKYNFQNAIYRFDKKKNIWTAKEQNFIFFIRNKEVILKNAENTQTRLTVGSIWRTAFALFMNPELGRIDDEYLFDVHQELSKNVAGEQELGNGLYVNAHRFLMLNKEKKAQDLLCKTSELFSLDTKNAESFYFSNNGIVKFGHLLATLSLLFNQLENKNKSDFCLALARRIFIENGVNVLRAGGLEAFCQVASRFHPLLLAQMVYGVSDRAEESDKLYAQIAQVCLSSCEEKRKIVTHQFYRDLFKKNDDEYSCKKLLERSDGYWDSLEKKGVTIVSVYNTTVKGGNAAIGDGAKIENRYDKVEIDLKVLSQELSELRIAARKNASEVEHDIVVGEIEAAETAANNGNKEAVYKHLANAGKWALDIASKIGVPLATEVLKQSMAL